MRYLVVLLILSAGALVLVAGGARATNVAGTISADTTWTAANSPYNVTGAVRVNNGATLTVEAGTTINMLSGQRLYIGDPSNGNAAARPGHLVLAGTASSPVLVNGQPIEFDGSNGAAAASTITNTTFNASAGWSIEDYSFSLLSIYDSTFQNPASGGLYLSAASPLVATTHFVGGPYGIYATDWSSTPSLFGNAFQDQATRYARLGIASVLGSNTFSGTGTRVQLMAGNRWYDQDVTLYAQPVTYELSNWLGIHNSYNLTIQPGFTAVGASDFFFNIGDAGSGTPSVRPATVHALGTSAQPIVIGSLSGTNSGSWQGFQFNGYNGAARASEIRNATLRLPTAQAVYDNSWSNLTIDNVTFENASSYSVYLAAASPTVIDSNFYGAPYGIYGTDWSSQPSIVGSNFWNQTARYAQLGVASYLDSNAFTGPGTGVTLLSGNRWYDQDVVLRAQPVTFYLNNWLGIHNGYDLTIQPGFTALGASDFFFNIGDAGSGTPSVRSATVHVLGTSAQPVVIGTQSGTNSGSWQGFQFNGYNGAARASEIHNATLRLPTAQAIYDNSWSNLTIDNVTIENASSYGMYLAGASPTVIDSTFSGSPYGVFSTDWSSRPSIFASTFYGQTSRYARVGLTSDLENNAFSASGTAVELLAGNRWVDESDVVIRNNNVPYDLYNWFGQRFDHTLRVDPGVVVRGASDATIYLGEPGTQGVAGVRANYGQYSYNQTAFAFHPGAAGNGCQVNGPDAQGYVCEQVPFTWSEISATGTTAGVQCDDCNSGAIPIGFNFSFYNASYQNVYVGSNGFITFSPGQGSGCCSGAAIPAYSNPLNVVAGYWTDLNPGNAGTVKYQTLGVAPDRDFVVEWSNVAHYPSGTPVTFELVLHENSTTSEARLMNVTTESHTHVTGAEGLPLPQFPRGRIDAEGTVAQPIVFQSLSGSNVNGWIGFRFQGASGGASADSIMRNVTAKQSTSYNVYLNQWNVGTFDNVTSGLSGSYGVYFDSASPTFVGLTANGSLTHNVFISSASPTLIGGSSSSSAGYGVWTNDANSNPTLLGFAMNFNAQRPLRIPLHSEMTTARFTGNAIQEIEYLAHDYTTDITVRPYYDAVSGAKLSDVLLQSFTIYNTANLTILPDTRLLVENSIYINIGSCCSNPSSRGNLTAIGTSAQPIFVGSRTGSSATGWYGFYFRGDYAGGHSEIRNATIATSRDANVEDYYYNDLTLDNVTLDHAGNQASIVSGASPTFINVNAAQPAWEGMYFTNANPTWIGGTIDHPGRSGLYSSGCGLANLVNVVIDTPASYGTYADSNCNGAHMNGVVILNATNRAWRDRLDANIVNVTVTNASIKEVEYWGDDITSDRTLAPFYDTIDGSRLSSAVLGTFTVYNQATLTLAPDLRLLPDNQVVINIGSCCSNPGSRGNITALGTAAQPVYVGSRSGNTATGWYGFYFRGDYAPGTSVMRNTTIALSRDDAIETYVYGGITLDNVTLSGNARYGGNFYGTSPTFVSSHILGSGSHGIYVDGGSIPVFQGGTIENSNGYGIWSQSSASGATLSGTLIENSTQRPARVRIVDAFAPALQNNTIREIEYYGVDVTSNNSLSPFYDLGDGQRYASVLLNTITVYNQATWTLQPDVRLLVGDQQAINVGSCCSNPGSRGNITTLGTSAQPVFIGSRSGSPTSGWYGLYFRGDYAPGTSVLRNTTVSWSRDDAIETYFYSGITLDNVTLSGNARYGANLYGSSPVFTGSHVSSNANHGVYVDGGSSPSFTDGTIDGNTGYGVWSQGSTSGASVLRTLVANNTQRPLRVRTTDALAPTLLANGIREIEYWGNDITSDRTLAPFYDQGDAQRYTSVVISTFTVYNQATWTIQPDVRLLVADQQAINIGSCCSNPTSRGNLTVLGTSAQPVFIGSRSGSPTGGWYGLYFRGDYAPGTTLIQNATIGQSRDDAIETYYYSGLTLDNVTLTGDARYGVNLYQSNPTFRNTLMSLNANHNAYFAYSSPTWIGGGTDHGSSYGIYTSGCGTAQLSSLTIESAIGYGLYADSTCNGANMDHVAFNNVTGRAFRNRLDASMTNLTVYSPTIREVELWGMTISGTRTLEIAPVYDQNGSPIAQVILGAFTVNGGAELMLDPDTQLRFRAGEYMTFGSSTSSTGRLTARGTRDHPINISGQNGVAWGSSTPGGINFDYTTLSRIQNTTVDGASANNIRIVTFGTLVMENVTSKRAAASGVVVGASVTAYTNDSLLTQNGGPGEFVDNGGVAQLWRTNASANGGNGLDIRQATVTVRGSTFYNNTGSGINATGSNPTLNVQQSYLWSNAKYGVDLQGTTGSTIFDNAFILNVQGQARATALNTWNTTRIAGRNIAYGPFLGGNSWSDYAGQDTDGDGLGDTLVPYNTSLGPGRDNYPVMGNLYADFTVWIPDIVHAPLDLVFNDSSRGGLSPADQWVWDLGDNSQFVTQNVTHHFAADGDYNVQQTVANDMGQLSQITKVVHVDSVPPVTTLYVNGTLGLNSWFTSAVNVTLNASDDRSGVNHTFYTLDGGALTTYTARVPVTSNGLHNVTFYSVDMNGNVEATKNGSFQLDRTPPVAGNATPTGTLGNAGWFVGDINTTLAATDNVSGVASIQYAYNATPNLTYAGGVPLTTDGTFLLRYRPVDNAGLVGAERNITLRRDATLPLVNLTEAGPLGGGGFWLGPVTVNVSATDATSGLAFLNYTLDNASAQPVNGSIVVSGHGAHYLNVTATDVAGNVNSTMRVILLIDLLAPVSEHHFNGTLGTNGVYITNVSVTFTGNDSGSGIDHYVYSFDDGPNTTFTTPVLINVGGQHRLAYYAVDVAGNAETVHQVVVTLDLEAPTTTLTLAGDAGQNGWYLSNVTGNLTVDNYSTLDHIVFGVVLGQTVVHTNYTQNISVDGEGVHNISYFSVGVGGLQEEEHFKLVKIDLQPPSVAATLGGTSGNNSWYISPVSVTLTPFDNASGIATTLASADGAPLATYTGPLTIASTGTHTIDAQTADIAGRSFTMSTSSFQVDVNDPITTLAISPATPDGANGWYTSSPTITLSATDVGAGVDRILLSIDGAPEQVVAGPIVLSEGNHTLAYHALDLAGRLAPVQTANVKVDLTPPSLSEILNGTAGNAGWYVSAVSATLTPSDATSGVATITASIDGGPQNVVNASLALATTGTHTIAWRAVDTAGLAANRTVTVKVDRSAPTTTATITPPAINGWRNQPANVTLSATDQPGFGSGVAEIDAGVDGAPLAAVSSPFTVGEGFHNLSFRGIDIAGLVNSTITQTLNVDLTPPTASATIRPADTADGWYVNATTVNVTASDALSGVAKIEYWVDNGGHTNTTAFAIQVTQEGSHVLHLRARDLADLVSTTIDVPYKIDLTAPTIGQSIAGTFGGTNRTVSWYRTPINVSLLPSDAGSGVASTSYSLDGGPNTTYAGPIGFATEGSHNITASAIDNVGRVSTAIHVGPFGVDLTPPTVTPTINGTLDAADNTYKTMTTVTFAASDLLSGVANGQLKVNTGAGLVTYTGPIVYNRSGNFSIAYQATDVAGNTLPLSWLNFSVFVDTTPPMTTLTPDPTRWYGAPVTAHLSAIDNQSTVASLLYSVDGGDLVTVPGNATNVTFATEGLHTLQYAALDVAGNSELFNTSTYKIDLTPPVLSVAPTFTQGNNGWIVSWVNLTPNATDALSGVANVVANVNGVDHTVQNGVYTISQSGWYNVTLRAIDQAGLVSNLVNWSGHLDLDAPRPTVTVVGPNGLNGWHNGNVSVLLTAVDTMSRVQALEYSWDNASFAPYPGQAFQFSNEGVHWLVVRVTDFAGNVGLTGGQAVGIDRTPPAIQTTIDGTQGNAGWWKSPVVATTSIADLGATPDTIVSGLHNATTIVDGGPNQTAAIPSLAWFNTSGIHTISAWALDTALNGALANVSIPVDVDDPALLYSVSGPQGLAGWYVGPVSVNATSADITSGPDLPLLNGEPMNATTTYSDDGVHDITLTAVDIAGRLGQSVSLPIKIDATPPLPSSNITGDDYGLDGWIHGNATISLAMQDLTSGPGEIQFKVDNGTIHTYAGPFNLTADGIHEIDWIALDVAGNAVSQNFTVKIDNTAPTAVAALSGVVGNNSWFRSEVNISLDAADPIAGVASIEYRIDDGVWLPYLGNITLNEEGRHVLQYRAISNSGLPSITYEQVILIDLTTPVVDLHLENTLFVEFDGKLYIKGTLCIEVTGLDALSGLNDMYLKVTGAVSKLIRIDLDVGLHCIDLDEAGGGGDGGGGDCEICAIAADLAGNENVDCFDAVFDPSPPSVQIIRPFPGALNLQNASIPLFKSVFGNGVTIGDTGVALDEGSPAGNVTFGGPTNVAVHNQTLADTTLVAGTHVPVWVAATDALSPISRVELKVDDQVVGVSNHTENETFQYVTMLPKDMDQDPSEPTAQVPPQPASNSTPASHVHNLRVVNVTVPVYVFYIDTLSLPAGSHNLSAKAWDIPGNLGKTLKLVGYVSPAIGNATMDAFDAAAADKGDAKQNVPRDISDQVPLGLWQQAPDQQIPPVPADVRDRIDTFSKAARIAAQLYDFLWVDNYAFVDRTVVDHMDLYNTTDAAIASLPAQPPPVVIDDISAWVNLFNINEVADQLPGGGSS